ncbi:MULTISPECIES: bifunctional riboflavin kinase/FAD synthetase [Glaesserella]|uniref:Riboflavin biosynthesis protein n=1 Tax=Glaesserella australis TaxID=2094024 RepID=A0A328BXM4_9PAST|nr:MULTISPECIES: bifunctional riboflavin kinase/FAD synthetase [Glaesserella]AUI67071.1 riboflavin biosynthesis protein RibF [Glaesserella sp. 15-184]RAL18187.1 bifunctional riboflavin kinase/FAD synthetase [Glaesserella australis]
MQLIRRIHSLAHLPDLDQGCALTIGNFDGVHLGHQQILHRLIEKAKILNAPSVVMIFEPQPREFFAKFSGNVSAPARLMRLRDKISALEKVGVDYLLCMRFNQAFSQLQPSEFIQELLVNQLNVKYLSVGDDFQFGYKRSGNFESLQNAGKQFGFEVEDFHSHCLDKERISSSLIRQALQHDDLALAEKMLGKPYAIRGRVAHGNKIGRTIGFPTANIMLNRLVTAIQGVYAVQVETADGTFNGIANVGNRPTINGTKPLLEVHIFNFDRSIYGQAIEVRFLKKIRSEIKFANFDELKSQIERDVIDVKNFFGTYKRSD